MYGVEARLARRLQGRPSKAMDSYNCVATISILAELGLGCRISRRYVDWRTWIAIVPGLSSLGSKIGYPRQGVRDQRQQNGIKLMVYGTTGVEGNFSTTGKSKAKIIK